MEDSQNNNGAEWSGSNGSKEPSSYNEEAETFLSNLNEESNNAQLQIVPPPLLGLEHNMSPSLTGSSTGSEVRSKLSSEQFRLGEMHLVPELSDTARIQQPVSSNYSAESEKNSLGNTGDSRSNGGNLIMVKTLYFTML